MFYWKTGGGIGLKRKGSLGLGMLFLAAIGMCIYGIGGIIITEDEYGQDVDEVREIAQESIIVVDRQVTATDVSMLGDTLEALDSDMVVESVETYVNVLEIPQYGILAYIYPDVSSKSLKKGVGHYPGTVGLGELGNCVIAGHSSSSLKCVLNPVRDMKVMDTFYVYDADGVRHRYFITDRYSVDPYSFGVLDTVDDTISQCTLLTCTRGGKQRLILEGKEFTDKQAVAFMEALDTSLVEEMLTINDQFGFEDYEGMLMNRGRIRVVTHCFRKMNKSMWGRVLADRVKFGGYLKEVYGHDVPED